MIAWCMMNLLPQMQSNAADELHLFVFFLFRSSLSFVCWENLLLSPANADDFHDD